MVIAVTCEFGDNFDQMVVFKFEGDKQREREVVRVAPGGSTALVQQLVGLEVDMLLTGRLPETLKEELTSFGIAYADGLQGSSDQLVKSYLAGELFD